MVDDEKIFEVLCKCEHSRNEHVMKPTRYPHKGWIGPDGATSLEERWYNCNKCSCEKYVTRKSGWELLKKDTMALIGGGIFFFGLVIFADIDLNLSSPQNIIGLILIIGGGGTVFSRYIQLKKQEKKNRIQ